MAVVHLFAGQKIPNDFGAPRNIRLATLTEVEEHREESLEDGLELGKRSASNALDN